MTDRDIFLIEVARRGRDGDYTGASEVAALDTRIDALEARPLIDHLDDLVPGASTGQVPIKQSGGQWAPATIPSGIIMTNLNDLQVSNVQRISVRRGLNIVTDPDGVELFLAYGGTGSASLVARSDHTHTTPSTSVVPFAPGGYMSSGTRPLASTSVVLAAGVSYLVQARLNMQIRGADAGQCYYRVALTIGSSTHESPAGTNGFWCVQGVPDKTMWFYPRTIVGTGAAVSISASVSYHSGGGFNTDAGEIEITLLPDR